MTQLGHRLVLFNLFQFPEVADKICSLAPGMTMKRRDFIAGMIFAASLNAAPAQQTVSLRRRIGVVSPTVPVADMTEVKSFNPRTVKKGACR